MRPGYRMGAVRRQDRAAHRRCGVADQDGDEAGVSGATMCAIASSGEGGPVGGVLSSCGATVFTRIPCGVLDLGHGVCPGQPARPADAAVVTGALWSCGQPSAGEAAPGCWAS